MFSGICYFSICYVLENMKVQLIFRDRSREGKSIEGIFRPLMKYGNDTIELSSWEYNASQSLLANVISLYRLKADVFHITGDISFLACMIWRRKVILTIHDTGRYKELHGLKKWLYRMIWIEGPVWFASRVIVVSKYTQADLLKIVPAQHTKIQVIHNGYNLGFQRKPKTFKENVPRILQVGTAIHKNIETLFQAAKGMNCVLSIVGRLTQKQVNLLHELGIRYENFVDVSQKELKEQYEAADIVVFVSTHEGFGLPVIEAQAVGRPVITSRLAAIPEIASEGAYFMQDPFDAKELASAIHQIMKDEKYRNSIIEKGFRNAERYTFENMANQYMRVYEKVGCA